VSPASSAGDATFRLTMNRILLGVLTATLLSLALACGGSDDDASTSTATSASDASSSPTESDATTPAGTRPEPSGTARPADSTFAFEIEEVGLGSDGYVSLRNFTDVPVSLEGLFLCQPPKCLQLPVVEVNGGDVGVIAASEQTDRPNVVATWPELELTPSDGELGVYVSEDVENPNDVRSYLQWGSTPHAGTEAAVEADLWIEGFAPSSENATRLFRDEGGLWLFEE